VLGFRVNSVGQLVELVQSLEWGWVRVQYQTVVVIGYSGIGWSKNVRSLCVIAHVSLKNLDLYDFGH